MQSSSGRRTGAPRPRSEILEISPYVQGKSELSGLRQVIKLSSNESAFGPSPGAIAAYQSVAASLHRYPDGTQRQLIEAIADSHGLDAEKIICGNGSDEILDLLSRAYLGPGDEIILSINHFAMSALYARIQGASIKLAKELDYVSSVDDIISKVSAKTRMITLANPANPSGTYLNAGQLRRIHDNIPGDVLLVIDGAYSEYVVHDDFENGSALVDEFDNVVTTRTFSKIYGLSALRIGWAYAPTAIINILRRIRSPFNTNSAAMAAAAAAVKDPAYIARVREHTAHWIVRLSAELRVLGITVIPSSANFYLLDFNDCAGKSAEAAAASLESRAIIPRQVKMASGEIMLRITVGLDAENEAVLEALKDYMN